MNRVIMPLLIPLSALAAAFVVVWIISRVLLAAGKDLAPPIALGVALAVLLASSFVASRVST
jgi:hypothetical protein